MPPIAFDFKRGFPSSPEHEMFLVAGFRQSGFMLMDDQETLLADDVDIRLRPLQGYDKGDRSQFSNYDIKQELAFEDDELIGRQRMANDRSGATAEEMQVEDWMSTTGMTSCF
jgi:hypothetical protein